MVEMAAVEHDRQAGGVGAVADLEPVQAGAGAEPDDADPHTSMCRSPSAVLTTMWTSSPAGCSSQMASFTRP